MPGCRCHFRATGYTLARLLVHPQCAKKLVITYVSRLADLSPEGRASGSLALYLCYWYRPFWLVVFLLQKSAKGP